MDTNSLSPLSLRESQTTQATGGNSWYNYQQDTNDFNIFEYTLHIPG